jgi:undecaprenyl-diphosphatase
MDHSLARTLNSWGYHHAWFGDLAQFFAKDAVFVIVAIAALAFLAIGSWASEGARRGAVSAAAALAIALLLAKLLSEAVNRSRPFVAHHDIHLLAQHARDAGFPSDHATGAFAIATALLLRHRRWGLLALLLAAGVAVSRVVVGAHYPTDVLAGAVLGATVALALYAPPIRRLLDAVADWASRLYGRLIGPRLGSQPNS